MFGLNLTNRSRASGFEDFQAGHRGGHLGYQNRTILAILNLCIAPMPPTTYRLNPTYGLGGDVCLKIFKAANMVAILDTGTE